MNLARFLAPALAAALISYLLTPLVGAIALRIGAVDRPGPRKIHQSPVPRLGGVAVLAAIVVAGIAMFWLPPLGDWKLPTHFWLGAGLGLVPIVGVSMCDDIRGLHAYPKFIAHLTGAVIAVWLGTSLGEEVHFFGVRMSIGVFAFPISVLWIAGVTNAFNIVDGLDGLSAGLGLISSVSLAAMFILVGHTGMAAAALVIAGALGGFLPYNIFPARMFLGDTGATAVGFCLAALALRSGSTVSAGFAVLLPVFVLGLPIAETLISVVRRILGRVEEKGAGGVFKADRNHIHHRLLALGIDHRRAVFILYGAGLLLATGALVSMFMTARDAALFALALLLAGFIGVAKLGYDEFAIIRNGIVLRLYEAPVLKRSMFVVFVDLLIVAIGVYCAVALKTDDWRLVTFRQTTFSMVAILAPITVVVFSRMDIYRGSWRVADAEDFLRISGAVLLATAVAWAARMLLPADATVTWLALFSIYALVSLVLVILSRASYQIIVAIRRRSPKPGTQALIYGAGRRGAAAFRELTSDLHAALRPVAFIDDDPEKISKLVSGVPILGSLRTMEAAVKQSAARAVIVSSDKISGRRLTDAHALCQRLGVAFLKMHVNFESFPDEAVPTHAASAAETIGTTPGVVFLPEMKRTSGQPGQLAMSIRAFDEMAVAAPAGPQLEPVAELTPLAPGVASRGCRHCGAFRLHRSHSRTLLERARKKFSRKRLYRCQSCGRRSWSDCGEILEAAIGQPSAAPSQLAAMLESIDTFLQRPASSTGIGTRSPARSSSNTRISQ